MSWLNTLLDVASLGVQVSQASKLSQLQAQHGDAAVIQTLGLALRSEIFKYKFAADEVLALEATDQRAAACALEILHRRLQQAGISPDLFPDLADKEYAATTQRTIRDHRNRLMAQLSPADQSLVQEVATVALNLPRLHYLLDYHGEIDEYRAIYPSYLDLKQRNTQLPVWLVRIVALLILGAALPIALVLSFLNYGISSAMFCLGGLALAFGSVYWAQRRARPAEYHRIQQRLEAIRQKVDVQQFFTIEQEFGADVDTVRKRYEADQELVNQFFSNNNFQSLLVG